MHMVRFADVAGLCVCAGVAGLCVRDVQTCVPVSNSIYERHKIIDIEA